jgi:hypothetical protein
MRRDLQRIAKGGEGMNARRRAITRPLLPHEEIAQGAKFRKPHPNDRIESSIDTSGLQHRKIHPFRDEGFLRWLTPKVCTVAGKVDQLTDQPHICWHPQKIGGRFASDPGHLEKAISGRTKQDDRYAIPLCRLAHNMQEGDTERFGRRFGINCVEIAEGLYAEYTAEKERGR